MPLDIIETHNVAVRNYLDFGRQIFENAERLGLQIGQISHTEGKPDKTLFIYAPLIPKPALPGLFGPPQPSVVGVLPALVAIGGLVVSVVSSPLFARLALLTVGGLLTTQALEQVKLIIHGYHDNFDPIKQGQAFISSFEACVAGGGSPDACAAAGRRPCVPRGPAPCRAAIAADRDRRPGQRRPGSEWR